MIWVKGGQWLASGMWLCLGILGFRWFIVVSQRLTRGGHGEEIPGALVVTSDDG